MATQTILNDVLYACSNFTTFFVQQTGQTMPSICHPYQIPNLQCTCWYSRAPLGHNKLRNAVADMCKQAGIPGYHTNYSLPATAATCLYHAGVDEQMVMERTRHRSLEGVRTYKRTSKQQRAAISDILNLKKRCLESSNPTQEQAAYATQSLSLNDTYQDTAHAFNFNVTSCGTVNIKTKVVSVHVAQRAKEFAGV